jgi:diacylglycerol kinase (ATP)
MHKTCLIFNPTAGGARRKKLFEELKRRALDVEFVATQAQGGGTDVAAKLCKEGFETFIAAGGDGSINDVLNGISPFLLDAGRKLRLGVLPLGTANVFARELGIPLNFMEAWSVIEKGQSRLVDLGFVNYGESHSGFPMSRSFIQLAGIGFDARAVELADLKRKRYLGALEYVFAGLKVALGPAFHVIVEANGERHEGVFAAIGNGRYYGGSFTLFPNASLDDGKLNVCLFQSGGLFSSLRYALGVLRGSHTEFRDVKYFTAQTLRVSSPKLTPFEVDGEFIGHVPAVFCVLPRALEVIVP